MDNFVIKTINDPELAAKMRTAAETQSGGTIWYSGQGRFTCTPFGEDMFDDLLEEVEATPDEDSLTWIRELELEPVTFFDEMVPPEDEILIDLYSVFGLS